jgi:hypothetical protein
MEKQSKRYVRGMSSLVGGVLLLVASSQARALMIDDFETGSQSLSTASGFASSTVAAFGALGGKRDVQIHVDAPPPGANDLELKVSIPPGQLSHSQGSQVKGSSTLEWDGGNGIGIDHTGLGVSGEDLTDGGVSDRLQVRVVESDLAINLKFTIYDVFGGEATGTLALPVGITDPTDYHLLFASFTGSVNWTKVGAIKLVINPEEFKSRDLTIDSVQTTHTPEPGTLLLLGTGLFSLAGYGWRRRKLVEHAVDSDTAL